jgi:ParB family chromosome partitioning protein
LRRQSVYRPNAQEQGHLAHGDVLAAAIGLNMRLYWSPSVENYLGRVSKDRISEEVREGVSKEAASNLATLKKQAMAEEAAKRLAGKGWLPPVRRAPHAPESMLQAAE